MRKIKKVNGYLIVKFNDRELRAWTGTALGNFGVIDAELYTGCLSVDRSVMEYDSAETLDEAIEQARGLESEIDIQSPTSFTVIKETDTSEELAAIDPEMMVNEWEKALAYQIKSEHYPDVNAITARHQLYGFMVALERLGLINEEECYIKPDVLKLKPGANFSRTAERMLSLGIELMKECPEDDCMVYRNVFKMCLELDEQISCVTGIARSVLEREFFKHQSELYKMYFHNHAIRKYRKEHKVTKTFGSSDSVIATPNMKNLQKMIEHFNSDVPQNLTIDHGDSPPSQPYRAHLKEKREHKYQKETELPLYPYGEHGKLLEDRPYSAKDAAEYRRHLKESHEEPSLSKACTACALKTEFQKITEPPVQETTPCSECPLRDKGEELKAVEKLLKEVEDYTNVGSHDCTSQSQE